MAYVSTCVFQCSKSADFNSVESKFCIGGLWKDEYWMSTCVKALHAATVVVMMWWGVPCHSSSLRLSPTVVPKRGKSSSVCSFSIFSIKLCIA